MSQVSAVVQTNAATAEENSATSEEMSAQAAILRQEVENFKLSGNEGFSAKKHGEKKENEDGPSFMQSTSAEKY